MLTTNTRWFWLFLTAFSLILIYLLSPILTPFIVAALLAYLCDPLVDRLEAIRLSRFRLSRSLAVTLVFCFVFIIVLLFLLFFIPLLEKQMKTLLVTLPSYIDWAALTLQPWLQQQFGLEYELFNVDALKKMLATNWQQAGGLMNNFVQLLSQSGLLLLGWLTNLALIPVVTFYLLRDWDLLIAYISDLMPRNIEPTVSSLATESDEMLGAFFRGQLLVMFALTSLYTFGLWLIDLEFALLIGMIAGVVSFVPYLGLIVGILIAGLASLFQMQEIQHLLMVISVFGVVQIIEGMVLTPLLVGERIGLHPVTVIFAVLAGGQLFGFFGVLLALPVAAVLAVIMRHLHHSYKTSQLYRI